MRLWNLTALENRSEADVIYANGKQQIQARVQTRPIWLYLYVFEEVAYNLLFSIVALYYLYP